MSILSLEVLVCWKYKALNIWKDSAPITVFALFIVEVIHLLVNVLKQGAEETISAWRQQVTGNWRKLHTKEIHNLDSSGLFPGGKAAGAWSWPLTSN
jgi:hypothetical protein